jgi:isocitrate dehydrogenase (NAD+)
MSALLMLRHLNEHDAANRAEAAMLAVFAECKYLTRDLGGSTNTADFASAIIDKLKASGAANA